MNVSRMAGLGGVSSAAMNKPHSAKDPDGRRIQNDTELQQRAAQTDRSQNKGPRGVDSVGQDLFKGRRKRQDGSCPEERPSGGCRRGKEGDRGPQ